MRGLRDIGFIVAALILFSAAAADEQATEVSVRLTWFALLGARPGMSGSLVAVEGRVPFAQTEAGTGYRGSVQKTCPEGDNTIRWQVPDGVYRLQVRGYLPVEVEIPQLRYLEAKSLVVGTCALSLSFTPPVTADATDVSLKPLAVPYLEEHPQESRSLDCTALPFGQYALEVRWRGARLCRRLLDLQHDTALTLGEADFAELVLAPLEVRIRACYSGEVGVDGVQVAGSAPVPANHPGTLELIAADGTRLALTRLKDRQVFAASVPPGKYRLVYTAPTLDRRETPGKQQACATRDGVFLTVEVPLQAGARQVASAKCDLTPGKPAYDLELMQSAAAPK